MATHRPYARPPITEAVIDMHFQSELSPRDLEKLRDKLKRGYPSIEPLNSVHVEINGSVATPTVSINGFKLTSENGADVVVVNKGNISSVRLAPYEGWDSLFKSSNLNFDVLLSVVKRPIIKRISTRFVNRLDIPFAADGKVNTTDYVSVGAAIPDGLAKLRSASDLARVELIDDVESLIIIINSGVANPALLDHLSFVVDIDVIQQEKVPLRYDEMWDRFAALRPIKNEIFESCITDAARALFK